jgi:hypothetical protein
MDQRSEKRKLQRTFDRSKTVNSTLLNLMFKKFFKINWKTTQAGIVATAAGLAIWGAALGDGFQLDDLKALAEGLAAIGGGIGLIFARDADKSSEESNG